MKYNAFFLYENKGPYNEEVHNEVFPELEKMGVRCFDFSKDEKQKFLEYSKLEWIQWCYVYTVFEREYPTLGVYFKEFEEGQIFLNKESLDLYKMKSDFNKAFKKGVGSSQFLETVKSRLEKSITKRNS